MNPDQTARRRSADPGAECACPPRATDPPALWQESAVPQTALVGVPIHAITEQECVNLVVQAARQGRGGWIVTLNLDHLRRCVRSRRYAATVEQANLRVADGAPLLWASRLQRTPLPGRVTGSNLIYSLTGAMASNGWSIYLLGGATGTAARAAQMLKHRYPALRVAGTSCPAPGFEKTPGAIRCITRELHAARPDMVFVALGSPKQEYLIRILRRNLPHAWWIGVGISFSFVCGTIRRAPHWMQRAGMEWLHRLVQEPSRLWRRYLLDDLPFCVWILAQAAVARSRR